MTVTERKNLRERTHLQIAVSAAVAAGLARTEDDARKNMEQILEKHGLELRAEWLRKRGGGIRGWLSFLRACGFQEQLVVIRAGGRPGKLASEADSKSLAA
jgi:hypothetical protein